MTRREQVFWGWGEEGAGPTLPEHGAELLKEGLGVSGEIVSKPVALGDMRLSEPMLPAGLRDELAGLVGAEHVRDDREIRVLRAAGKSYLDLLALRAGDAENAPDAVVAPGDGMQVARVLEACATAGVAVVPFGGGTSVVGGLTPNRGGHPALVSLDLGRIDAVTSVDRESLTAVIGPGRRLPETDHALAEHGLWLGHMPQSYEWATVGGCVATRSSGQASTQYGRIDRNVLALRLASPVGELVCRDVPGTAAGPDLRQLAVGSEGTLGVITEITLRVHPKPPVEHYEGWLVESFEAGCAVLRELEQEGAAPAVSRLSDEDETAVTVGLSGGLNAKILGTLTKRRQCLMICGWLGPEATVARTKAHGAKVLRKHGAWPLGERAGEGWNHGRFAGPHLRDDLLDRGVLTETLETAASWTRLPEVHRRVGAALRTALGEPALVGCHVSHLYPSGASLYFTVLAPQNHADPAGQWQRAKAAASDQLLASGATITHHHAVGADHAPWMRAELGNLGHDVLRTLKARLDPAGILNPGKLIF